MAHHIWCHPFGSLRSGNFQCGLGEHHIHIFVFVEMANRENYVLPSCAQHSAREPFQHLGVGLMVACYAHPDRALIADIHADIEAAELILVHHSANVEMSGDSGSNYWIFNFFLFSSKKFQQLGASLSYALLIPISAGSPAKTFSQTSMTPSP